MLSRLALRPGGILSQVVRPCVGASQRHLSLSPVDNNKYAWYRTAWPAWQMYKDKVGSSGATIMIGGSVAYLLSKEIFMINDEFMLLCIMTTVAYNLSKFVGPVITKQIDDGRKEILDSMNQGKHDSIASLKEMIANEKEGDEVLAIRKEFFDISHANNKMSLETVYRSRLHEVENEVKKRLDYQIDMQNLELKIEEEHISNWIEKQVVASITGKQDVDTLAQCIKDLNVLASKHATA